VLSAAEQRVTKEIEKAIEEALASKHSRTPEPESAATGVYAVEGQAVEPTAVGG